MIREDNVIDNKKVILKDEPLKILPKTENASIAVGYFFISGLSVIIQSLKDIDKVRLLISNTTDKTTTEALIEGFHTIQEICIDVSKKKFVKKVEDNKKEAQVSLDLVKPDLIEYDRLSIQST